LTSENQERLRPISQVAKRWLVLGKTIQEILDMNPKILTLPEWGAWRAVKNAVEAKEGSQQGIRAAEVLRLIIDGPEETIDGKDAIGAVVALIDGMRKPETVTAEFVEEQPQLTEGESNEQPEERSRDAETSNGDDH
jgi:hypothetical protein